jgi:hypothetical protein
MNGKADFWQQLGRLQIIFLEKANKGVEQYLKTVPRWIPKVRAR